MYLNSYLLFCIVLLLCLGAVIAFSLFVIKPTQTRWAVRKARKIVAEGNKGSDWHFRNVYLMLATAHDDLEAAELWHELKKVSVSSSSDKCVVPSVKRAKSSPGAIKATIGLSAAKSTVRSISPAKTSKPRKSGASSRKRSSR